MRTSRRVLCVRAPLIMVKAFSIDFYSKTNTSQPIDSLWFCSLHMWVNPSGEPQILTKTCVEKASRDSTEAHAHACNHLQRIQIN